MTEATPTTELKQKRQRQQKQQQQLTSKNNMQQLRQRLHATTLTKTTSDDCKIPKTTSTRDFPAPCKTECGYRLLSTSERTAGCTTEHLLKLHFSLLFINKHLKLYFV